MNQQASPKRGGAGKTRAEQRGYPTVILAQGCHRHRQQKKFLGLLHVNFFAIFMSLSCVDKNRYYSGFGIQTSILRPFPTYKGIVDLFYKDIATSKKSVSMFANHHASLH